jgi:hypothetical protein
MHDSLMQASLFTNTQAIDTQACAIANTMHHLPQCHQYRADQWEKSLELLDEILQLGWQPTRYSRNAAMDACGKVSRF